MYICRRNHIGRHGQHAELLDASGCPGPKPQESRIREKYETLVRAHQHTSRYYEVHSTRDAQGSPTTSTYPRLPARTGVVELRVATKTINSSAQGPKFPSSFMTRESLSSVTTARFARDSLSSTRGQLGLFWKLSHVGYGRF